MQAPCVKIRAVRGAEDCEAVIELCATAFPEEARATGMPIRKWRDLKTQDLMRYPELWRQCGVAVEDGRILGATVLTVDDEPDAALSYWQLTRRAGCLATLRTMCYDQVLDEALEPHECLIDFLAVKSEARGKGVGALLLEWAGRTAADILSERVPQDVATHGVLMTLWVAADNDPACRLYNRNGYAVTKRTGESPWACLSSKVFTSFLGHPVWHKMSKVMAVPLGPGGAKLQQEVASVQARAGGPAAGSVAVGNGEKVPPHVGGDAQVPPLASADMVATTTLMVKDSSEISYNPALPLSAIDGYAASRCLQPAAQVAVPAA